MSLNPFQKKSYVGIDIGHKTIQIVQLDKAGGGKFRVSKAVSVPTPSESVHDSVVTDVDAVGMALKGAMREAKIHATAAVTSVSGGSVVVRVLRDIPKMTPEALRKSIKYEAGRYVPSSVEDSYVEFEVLGDADEDHMEIMIVAAPRDVVDSRIQAIEKAGLEVDIVDVAAFACYRSLVECDESSALSKMTIGLVDIGAHVTTVSVVSDGKFAMTRTIPQGSQAWTDALKDYFRLDEADAESGKSQLDLTPLTTDEVLDNQPLRVLQPQVDDLVREVRRSLNYYHTQQGDDGPPKQVTHVLLSGGGAKLKGIGEYFAYKLNLEALATGVYLCPKFVAPAGATDEGMDLSVATGLAMRSVGKIA